MKILIFFTCYFEESMISEIHSDLIWPLIISFLGPVLPQAMRLHSMVAVPDLDSVITVGGLIDSETAIDDLYELTCQPDDCVWNKKEQTLKNARYNMVATIVPDELITCQERKLPK